MGGLRGGGGKTDGKSSKRVPRRSKRVKSEEEWKGKRERHREGDLSKFCVS